MILMQWKGQSPSFTQYVFPKEEETIKMLSALKNKKSEEKT